MNRECTAEWYENPTKTVFARLSAVRDMSLNIGDALSAGAEKLTTAAGVQLGVAYVVLLLVTVVGSNSMSAEIPSPPGSEGMAADPALALPIGFAGGAVLFLLGMVLNLGLAIVAFRTLDHDASELGSIPSGVTDGLLKRAVFLVIAGIVQTIAIAIGWIALFIPGIFIAVSLIFTQVYVAIEGEGPFEALSSSWSLAKGNRFPLFGLGVVITVIGMLTLIPSFIALVFSPIAGVVVMYVILAFFSVFQLGVMVDAYHQLEADESMAAETTDDDDDDDDGVERLDDDDSGFDYA